MVRKPHWYPRLRLMPHHFEMQDAYHEELLGERLAALHEFTWGILDLNIDARALEGGQVVISKLVAVLPDGTFLSTEDDRRLERTFPTIEDEGGLDVLIGVPIVTPNAPNVDREGDPRALHRYVEQRETRVDLLTGRQAVDVSWSRPNACLLFDNERVDTFSTVRCARLIRRRGRVQLDPHFIPPVAAITASSTLTSGIRRVLSALSSRHSSLVAHRARPTSDFSGADALRYWMLSVVGGFVPRISDLLDRRTAHPHDAYRVLVELQGALSAFTPSGTNETVKFDYLDMTSTFEPLFATILQILESLGQQQYREISTRRHDDRLVYAELREPAIFRNEFFIGVTGVDAEAVRQQVPRLVKIATWDEVPTAIGSAVAGVPLKHEYRAPNVLPVRPGIQYFRLDKSSTAWASIVRKGTLGIYHPPDLGTLEIMLCAVDPSLV